MHELGAMLRKRREAMGATLAEVETATKIRQKYLAALEADEWQLLPGEVVGRGFLRNYATYLGLDANELIERRRAVADPSLAIALAGTSAASALPPQRPVDYRPKDVPLHEEDEGIEQRRELRLGPFFATAGVVVLLILVLWGVTAFGGRVLSGVGALFTGTQEWASSVMSPATATPTEPAQVAAVGDNIPTFTPTAEIPATPAGASSEVQEDAANRGVGGESAQVNLVPTATPTPLAEGAAVAPTATTQVEVSPPTETSPPEPPTPTPTDTPAAEPPTPTPTDTPEDTPTPEPPLVVAPACPDPRAVISAPGVNAVVSGNVSVTGRAAHEIFEYYKLEYAPGADAADGFFYFGGANSQVEGGLLGAFSSSAVANGVYTIRLTVVDQTGNFPPPCQVTVVVQN